jgi:hypothetical protein
MTRDEKYTLHPRSHKVIEISDRSRIHAELAQASAECWELVSATSMFNSWMTKVVNLLFSKRPAG